MQVQSQHSRVVTTPADGETFTIRQVSRLFEVAEHRLRYWSQTGFVAPSIRKGERALYSFRDLIAIKVAKALLDAGLPLQRVRRSLDALKVSLPRVDVPLSRLRIRCDHDRVLVDDESGTFDACTGQLVLDFRVETLGQEVAQVLALPWAESTEPARTAYEWFLHARKIEESGPEQREQARQAYGRAVELDRDFAAAWTNLGSFAAEDGDLDGARDCFAEALRCDPDQPEAHVNLAELALRDGDIEVAISGYRQVLRLVPDYCEAHYGLARALLTVGGRAQALAHLERFCSLVMAVSPGDRDPSVQARFREARAKIVRLKATIER